MDRLKARFAVTTPLFLGGADNTRVAELREFSVRGVLRFWWRALAWARHGDDLEAMHGEESALFGSADAEFGQGAFLMRMRAPDHPAQFSVGAVPFNLGGLEGARYLGYGLMEAFSSNNNGKIAGRLTRPCLPPPLDFEVEFLFRKSAEAGQVEQLSGALIAFGLLGGLGSRSRRGFGSVTLLTLQRNGEEVFRCPVSRQEYGQRVGDLLAPAAERAGEPEYSAFSQGTRVDVLSTGSDPLALLDGVGKAMQLYRSFGNNGRALGREAECNFKDDHDIFYAFVAGPGGTGAVSSHPRRAVFGLPHNYYSKKVQKKMDCGPKGLDRRASPLLLHVHRFGENNHAVVATLLRSRFLPAGTDVVLEEKRRHAPDKVTVVPQTADYAVLEGFLDGFEGPAGRKTKTPYFPQRTKVFP